MKYRNSNCLEDMGYWETVVLFGIFDTDMPSLLPLLLLLEELL